MLEEKARMNVGDKISGEIVVVAQVSRLARPEIDYDHRRTYTFHLDTKAARELVCGLNHAKAKELSWIQEQRAIRLDDGRYLLLDLHHQHTIEVTELPKN